MQFQSNNFQKLILIFLFICAQAFGFTGGVLYFAGVAETPSGTPPITDYVAWYDAADTSTIATDDPDLVRTWADKSGNGYDAQAHYLGSSYQPITASATLNGKNVILFQGDYMTLPLNAIPQGDYHYTICFVGEVHSGAIRTMAFLGYRPTGSSDNYKCIWLQSSTNADYILHRWYGDDLNTPSGSLSGGSPFYSVYSWGGADRHTYLNNSDYSDTPTHTLNIPSTNTSARLGGDGAGGSTLDSGDFVAELIIYHRALSSSEINDTITYLKDKWGL